MTISTKPTFVDSLTYAGLDLRLVDVLLAQSDGTAGGAQPGVRPGDTGLVTSVSGTTITVTAGAALIYKAGQGVYRASSPAAWTGTLAAANATNPRVDLVYLRVWDNAVDGTGLYKADIVYLQGTAAPSPVAPSPGITEIYVPLAKITVPASGGGSPSVADARPCYIAPGGIGVGSGVVGTYQGQWNDDGAVKGTLSRWNGTLWEAILGRSGGGLLSSPNGYQSFRTATTDVAYSIILNGDGFDRMRAYGDGKLEWGPGNASRDTNLYRAGVGILKTDGKFQAAGMTTAVVEDTTAGRTTTSGTYIGVGGMAATITVPPSGAVRIHLRCTSRAVSSSYNALTCIQVSGSVSGTVYTANDLAATIVNGSTNISLVQDRVVTGLSAGETLTVTPMHRINSTGGTMTVDYRYLTVTPALA